MTQRLGEHLVVDLYACGSELIGRADSIKSLLLDVIQEAGLTALSDLFHESPWGVRGTVITAELHVCVHTWPEHLCVFVDILSSAHSESAGLVVGLLCDRFAARRVEMNQLNRGEGLGRPIEDDVRAIYQEMGLADGYKVSDFDNDVSAILALVEVERRLGVAFQDGDIDAHMFSDPSAMVSAVASKLLSGPIRR